MRLIYFSNVYPTVAEPQKGTFNQQLVRALRQRSAVTVVSPVAWTGPHRFRKTRDQSAGVTYLPYFFPPRLGRAYYHHFMWHSLKTAALAEARRFSADAIVSYWAHPDGAVGNRLARSLSIPSVIIVGGSDVLVDAKGARRRAVASALDNADAVATVSAHLEAAIRDLGAAPKRLQTLYFGVDPELFHPASQQHARIRLGLNAADPVLLWVGRMVPVKRVDLLTQAMRLIAAELPDCRLYLVGDGPLRPWLEAQIAQLGLGGNLRLVGAQTLEQLPDWYRAADITVLTSDSEGIPNVLMESMACGTPWVSTRVGGVPEIPAKDMGRMAPPGDPQAFAAAVLNQLKSREKPRHAVVWKTWGETADDLLGLLGSLGN